MGRRQIDDTQEDGSCRAVGTPVPRDGAADHALHQRVDVDGTHRVGRHSLPVAQHRDAIGDSQHLVEAMADVQDAGAACSEGADSGKQLRRFRLAEHRGRLVEQQEVGGLQTARAPAALACAG